MSQTAEEIRKAKASVVEQWRGLPPDCKAELFDRIGRILLEGLGEEEALTEAKLPSEGDEELYQQKQGILAHWLLLPNQERSDVYVVQFKDSLDETGQGRALREALGALRAKEGRLSKRKWY